MRWTGPLARTVRGLKGVQRIPDELCRAQLLLSCIYCSRRAHHHAGTLLNDITRLYACLLPPLFRALRPSFGYPLALRSGAVFAEGTAPLQHRRHRRYCKYILVLTHLRLEGEHVPIAAADDEVPPSWDHPDALQRRKRERERGRGGTERFMRALG